MTTVGGSRFRPVSLPLSMAIGRGWGQGMFLYTPGILAPGDAMSGRSAFVYSPDYLAYKLSEEHPLNPIRLALTESLIEACGLLDGPDVFRAAPRMASDDEVMYAHDREYVERVRDLGHAPRHA